MNKQRYSRYTPPCERSNLQSTSWINYNSQTYPSSLKYDNENIEKIIPNNSYERKTYQNVNKYELNESPPDKDNYLTDYYKKPIDINGDIPSDNRPLGLPNSKSYCYMNSVIQSLSHCIEFSNAVLYYRLNTDEKKIRCKKEDEDFISLFFQLMNDIGYRNKNSVEASSQAFQDMHNSFAEFAEGEQDADEYLQFLLNKLNDVTKAEPKKVKRILGDNKDESFKRFLEDNDNFATRLFCGQMNNELNCFSCNFSKPSYQVFWVLPLPIPTKYQDEVEISLESCLTSMLTVDKLDEKSCSKCFRKNTISTRTEITHWPIYLIIHLKRHIQSGYSYKSSTKITLPINHTIKMSPDSEYSLLGVIDHIGSTTCGHYVAKFRDLNDPSIWWRLNDTIVSRIVNPDDDIVTGNTTTYFFSKSNTDNSDQVVLSRS